MAIGAISAHAQQMKAYPMSPIKDGRVEALMDKRMLDCDDIYYNALSLIPRFHRAGNTDTVDAVLSYWTRYCGLNEANVAYILLSDISAGRFSERLVDPKSKTAGGRTAAEEYYRQNIISFLTEYCRMFSSGKEYVNYYREAGMGYYAFIQEMAVALKKNNLSPAERFLVDFYADPDISRFARLRDSSLNGTVIQAAYGKQQAFGGLYMGIGSGMWHPMGKLSLVGNQPIASVHMGGRGNRFYVDANIQFRFLSAADSFLTVYQGALISSKHHFGIFAGADAGYALLKGRTHELDVQGGFGYDGLEVVANTAGKNQTDNSKTLGSLNLGGGLGYRVYLTHKQEGDNTRHSFFQLLVRYNAVSYRNPGGTDFTGNAITFGIIYGGYFNAVHKYYDPK